MSDQRYIVLKNRLNTLSSEQLLTLLKTLVKTPEKVCFDEFNYDETNKSYCPLAIAYQLNDSIENPTNDKITQELSKYFEPVNVIKGVEGDYYTENRKDDIIDVIFEILQNKLN